MSEQKYYVKFKNEVAVKKENDYYGYDFPNHGYVWLDIDCDFYPEESRHPFTKSELAEIMDGALYTQTLSKDCMTPDHVYYGSGEEIVSEWTNPLIELIPVEEEDVSN